MAKPGGAITPGDGALAVLETTDFSFAYFCFRLPYQPRHWKDGFNDKRHTAAVALQVTIDAGTALLNEWRMTGDPSSTTVWIPEADINGAKVASWETRDETNPLRGKTTSFPVIEDDETKPRYVLVRLKFQKDDANTAEVLGISLELLDNDEYTDPAPSGARKIELTDRGTNKLYKADEPVSAWHVQWLLCHTLNKMMFKDTQVWSMPL